MVTIQQQAKDGVKWMANTIEQLQKERDYLDARCAELEQVCREFVKYEYPDAMCRERIKAVLNKCEESEVKE